MHGRLVIDRVLGVDEPAVARGDGVGVAARVLVGHSPNHPLAGPDGRHGQDREVDLIGARHLVVIGEEDSGSVGAESREEGPVIALYRR